VSFLSLLMLPRVPGSLEALEREEDALASAWEAEHADMLGDVEELTGEEAGQLLAIRKKKKKMVDVHRLKKTTAGNKSVLPRTVDRDRSSTTANMSASLGELGLDASRAVERARERSLSRTGRKRSRSLSAAAAKKKGDAMDAGEGSEEKKRVHSSKTRSMSRGRSVSLASPSEGKGIRDASMRNKALKLGDVAQRKANKSAKKGEGDRVILNPKPKHLFSGKRGKGKTDWR